MSSCTRCQPLSVTHNTSWPPGQRPVCFKSSPCHTLRFSLTVSHKWPHRAQASQYQVISHDAAGIVQPGRPARPADISGPRRSAGREERASAAAPGPLHVLRHYTAAGMHAATTGGASSLPVRTGTVERSSTHLSCRVQTNNWSPAPRNVWGKCFLFELIYTGNSNYFYLGNRNGFLMWWIWTSSVSLWPVDILVFHLCFDKA